MAELNQIYKCSICGNIVEILHAGEAQLACCNESMELLEERDRDDGQEKHVPVIEKLPPNNCKDGDGVKVKVGEVPHPMAGEHYIEWIEIETSDNRVAKKFLKPGNAPEAEFNPRITIQGARAYCNVHGLWSS
jgi:superoxide reductase